MYHCYIHGHGYWEAVGIEDWVSVAILSSGGQRRQTSASVSQHSSVTMKLFSTISMAGFLYLCVPIPSSNFIYQYLITVFRLRGYLPPCSHTMTTNTSEIPSPTNFHHLFLFPKTSYILSNPFGFCLMGAARFGFLFC